jgi:hypothetical protein
MIKICIDKHLSNIFPIQNCLNHRRCFIATSFHRYFQIYQEGDHDIRVELKLNGTHQVLAYAYDLSLLGDNIHTTKKNTLIDASVEIGLEVNAE